MRGLFEMFPRVGVIAAGGPLHMNWPWWAFVGPIPAATNVHAPAELVDTHKLSMKTCWAWTRRQANGKRRPANASLNSPGTVWGRHRFDCMSNVVVPSRNTRSLNPGGFNYINGM